MKYTINKLAQISGVTTRTLRYYDQIGLLQPARINSSGYRIYSQKEVDLLQQILFYRELGGQPGRRYSDPKRTFFRPNRCFEEPL